jgi:hypothetical protein
MPLVRDFLAWRGAVRMGDTSEAEGLRTYLVTDSISLLIILALGVASSSFCDSAARVGHDLSVGLGDTAGTAGIER